MLRREGQAGVPTGGSECVGRSAAESGDRSRRVYRMTIRPALLVIADIGGYTAFMKAHKTSLAHAQDVVARLLEAVIDAAPNLTLLEIEGDAAFFYAWPPDSQDAASPQMAANQILARHRACQT